MFVISAGMYRACSTWQYQVMAHLIERKLGGSRVGFQSCEQFGELESNPVYHSAWAVLKSHDAHWRFSRAVAEGRAKVVYAYRDVRDVIFSLMSLLDVSFETLLRKGTIHQILANDRFWTAQPGVLSQRYESLIADPVTGVEQLAAFVGVTLADGEAAEIAEEYSLQSNRQRTLNLRQRLHAQKSNLDALPSRQSFDPHTLLRWNHVRDGRPNKWRAQATPCQRAILALLCDDWLEEHGYDSDTAVSPPENMLASFKVRARSMQAWIGFKIRGPLFRHPSLVRKVKRCLGVPIEHTSAMPLEALAESGAKPANRLAA